MTIDYLPRLRPIMRNGARRADFEAVIDLFLQSLGSSLAPVAAFIKFSEVVGFTECTADQWSMILHQKAVRGELYCETRGGNYYYGRMSSTETE